MLVNTVFRKFTSELTKIDGKSCNNIPEAVNKLLYQPALAILVKLGELNMTLVISLNKFQSFITG
jgi:hypothetical protein